MKKHVLIRASISLVSGIALSTISGTAIADGLQSQFKARMPFYPGYAEILTAKERSVINTVQMVTIPTSKIEVTAMTVRKNQRAVQRRQKWFGYETKIVAEAHAGEKLPVNMGNRVMRPRLVYRGSKTTPTNCNNLHTHARSVCLHDQQLQKMVRLQK